MLKKWAGTILAAAVLVSVSFFIYEAALNELGSNRKPILFVPKAVDKVTEFWLVMNQGVFAAAQQYNAKVEIAGTESETDIEGQIRLLEKAISDKPRAIVLAATDYTRLVPIAQKIKDAGIVMITVDSGLKGELSSSFIATDNYAAGKKAGLALKNNLQGETSVAIINFVKGSATAMERESGVKDSLIDDHDIRIVETLYSDGSKEKAYQLTKRMLETEPAIKGIIGLNEPSTVGAARAVKEVGAASAIKLVGFDSSMDEVSFLEDGTLQATVVQKPFNMGYLAIKTALEVNEGKKVSARIDTGSEVITKENMYTNENQKLLFPFVEK